MKNLINLGIEKLEEVPLEHLSHRPTQAKKANWFGWKGRKSECHDIDGISPFTIAERIIEKNIGKSFDGAFSYFCKLVPKYQQHIFLNDFNQSRRYRFDNYMLDSENNIQYNPNSWWYKHRFTKKIVTFSSEDYETQLVHKTTRVPFDKFDEVYEKIPVYYTTRTLVKVAPDYYKNGKFLYYQYSFKLPVSQIIIAQKKDFELVTIKGWKKTFESKNDPRFKKLMSERRKKSRKQERLEKIARKQKQYSFISKSELELKRQKEEDKYKILAHGFDLITSFRSDKQTNPDLIKEKQ